MQGIHDSLHPGQVSGHSDLQKLGALVSLLQQKSNNSQTGKALSSSLKLNPFADLFGSRHAHIQVGLRRRGGTISIYLSYLLYFILQTA